GLASILYNANYGAATGGGISTPMDQTAALLRPLVNGASPSRRVRQLYADTLNLICLNQQPQQALPTCDEALKTLAGLGALDLSDLNAAASWADTADTKSGELQALGRIAEAQKLEQQVFAMTEKVLAHRPGDLHALEDRFFAARRLAGLADSRHDVASATSYANQTVQAARDWVRFDPPASMPGADGRRHWSGLRRFNMSMVRCLLPSPLHALRWHWRTTLTVPRAWLP